MTKVAIVGGQRIELMPGKEAEFREALSEAAEIELKRMTKCPDCNGSGSAKGCMCLMCECETCKGEGVVAVVDQEN